MFGIVQRVKSVLKRRLHAVGTVISRMTKPVTQSPVRATITDLARTKSQLLAENLLLRQQLVVLNRSVKRPRFTAADRGLFVLLASRVETWKDALLIVKPETVLRWHRQGFQLFWKRKSRPTSCQPKRSR